MKSTRMMELRTTMPAWAIKPIMAVAVKKGALRCAGQSAAEPRVSTALAGPHGALRWARAKCRRGRTGGTVMTMSGGVDDAIADPSIFKLGDLVGGGWAKPLTRPAVFFG